MNKYQDAINEIKNNNDYDPTYNFDGDSYDVLQELIDKEEKYRWHDLRKDPNDLPKIDNEINVIFESSIKDVSNRRCVAYKVDEDCLNDLKRGYVGNFVLLAWKYIEEFEEVIDKEDKYRWHDLRKDPTDLPKTFDTCILVTPDNEYVITRYFVDEDVWEYDYSSGSDNLAWRYMEDFKHE